jgi:hypothetical protein
MCKLLYKFVAKWTVGCPTFAMRPCGLGQPEGVESWAPGNRLRGPPPRPLVPRAYRPRVQKPRSRTRPKHCWKFPEPGPELGRKHTRIGAHFSLACCRLGQAIIATTTDVDVARIGHDTLILLSLLVFDCCVLCSSIVVDSGGKWKQKWHLTTSILYGSGNARRDGLLYPHPLLSSYCWTVQLC